MWKDGNYFVAARSFNRKSDGRPLGVVELVIVTDGLGSTQTVFVDAEFAERARAEFRVGQAVNTVFTTELTYSGPRAQLTELAAV